MGIYSNTIRKILITVKISNKIRPMLSRNENYLFEEREARRKLVSDTLDFFSSFGEIESFSFVFVFLFLNKLLPY